MIPDAVARHGLVLVGCGKMGSALLAGWLRDGLAPGAITVVEPAPSDWLRGTGVSVGPPPRDPAVVVVAVKPQVMAEALPGLAEMLPGAVISIAAGTPIARFEAVWPAGTPVVRAMPNTPAAIGQGITAIVGHPAAIDLAEALMGAVGAVVRLDAEADLDAVTALSGSGPAYVFHLIEAMTAAGVALGLTDTLAARLATATVAGAGALAVAAARPAAELRADVTSPAGTTAASLAVLMDTETGLAPLIARAMAAAAARSRALSA